VQRSELTRQRLAAVFLAGVLLLYSPLISLFEGRGEWLGIPVLYLYLFGAWATFIALTAWVAGRGGG
jgi:hypothetical protein